jgi:hypothetical protein
MSTQGKRQFQVATKAKEWDADASIGSTQASAEKRGESGDCFGKERLLRKLQIASLRSQ